MRVGGALEAGMRWLDVGCGRGLAPVWFADADAVEADLRLRAGCLVGLDLDLDALRANRSCTQRVLGTVTALPFAARSYDLVTCNMVLEHHPDPGVALAEVRRILRPGGRAILHTPNLFGIVTIAAWIVPGCWHPAIVRWIEGRVEGVHPKHYAFNRRCDVERCLRDAGFRNARVEYIDSPNTYGGVPIIAQVEAIWHRLSARIPALRATLIIEAVAD